MKLTALIKRLWWILLVIPVLALAQGRGAITHSLPLISGQAVALQQQDTTQYRVLINAEQQYSIWPVFKETPLGWKDTGFQGTKDACLAYIQSVWKDLRPTATPAVAPLTEAAPAAAAQSTDESTDEATEAASTPDIIELDDLGTPQATADLSTPDLSNEAQATPDTGDSSGD